MVEPWLYGHNTGLSPIAVIVAATFWTWLWGPIGLLLSTPLTVCLVMLGRHVKQLEFFEVILGDEPALSPEENFYQRMLAGDPHEAADQAEQFLKEQSLSAFYDEVAVPGLALAQADLSRGLVEAEKLTSIRDTVQELVHDLSDHDDQAPTTKSSAQTDEAVALRPSTAEDDRRPVPEVLATEELSPAGASKAQSCALAVARPLTTPQRQCSLSLSKSMDLAPDSSRAKRWQQQTFSA